MNIRESEFWKSLKKLMRADDHVPVPDACVARAIDLFQPAVPAPKPFLFQLRPAFLGAVRRAGASAKMLYELEDRVVQLEKTMGEDGMSLTGFAHGFDDTSVTLHGQESVFQTVVDAGAFSFEALPEGTYALCFSRDGEAHWITGVEVTAPV